MAVSDRTYDKTPERTKIDTQSVPTKRTYKKLPKLNHLPKLPMAKSATPYELHSAMDHNYLARLPPAKKAKKLKRLKKKHKSTKRKLSNSAFDMYTMDQLYGVHVLHTVYK